MIANVPDAGGALGERLVIGCGERRECVRQIIRSAQRDLAMSLFRCDDFEVLDEIAEAIARKARVRALITNRAKNWDRRLRDLGEFLESMGAEIVRYSGPYEKYHAKYIIADGARALVASGNFTRKCFDQTCDFVAVTSDQRVVTTLSRLFESDCCTPAAAAPVDPGVGLIVGPEHARQRFLELLRDARRAIRIIDHRVSDPEIIATLRARQADGVSVAVLGRGELPGLISHGKMLLVDDSIATIGSISLFGPSLDLRREVAMVLRSPDQIAELRAFFEQAASSRLGGSGIAGEWSPSLVPPDDAEDDPD